MEWGDSRGVRGREGGGRQGVRDQVNQMEISNDSSKEKMSVFQTWSRSRLDQTKVESKIPENPPTQDHDNAETPRPRGEEEASEGQAGAGLG